MHTLKGPPTHLQTHRKYYPPSYNTHTPTILQHSYTKGTPHPLPPTHRKYHPPSYNTHTLKGSPPPPYPQPTGSTTHHLTTLIHPPSYNTHTPTIIQHSYTKGTPHPPPPIHRKYHPPSYNTHSLKGPPAPPPTPNPPFYNTHTPTILQHSYTKGTPTPYSQPTGSTTHHVTTLIHPQSYNTHTLKGHPPPYPNPQEVQPTILQHSYTKGNPHPHPIPPTHRKYHPPSYNTHTPTILQHSYTTGTPHPPTRNPQEVPPTILQHSYTHNLTTLIH